LKSMLNPLLKYIDPVRPLEMIALYEVYKAKRIAFTDLATRLGAPRKDLEDAIAKLNALGYIEIEREGNRKILTYVKGLFRGLKQIAPSEEGYRIARRVLLRYYGRGYVALPAKQDSSLRARPDLVAVPVDKATWRPRYSEAIAIEIESCNELETHPEHVVRNWIKESVKDFREIHSWTSEECFEKLKQLYDKHPEVHGKVRVFSVRMEKPGKPVVQPSATLTAPSTTDERARVVEVQGKRYRVVFRSIDDAARFDRFSGIPATQISIRGSEVVIYMRSLGKSITIQAERVDELTSSSS